MDGAGPGKTPLGSCGTLCFRYQRPKYGRWFRRASTVSPLIVYSKGSLRFHTPKRRRWVGTDAPLPEGVTEHLAYPTRESPVPSTESSPRSASFTLTFASAGAGAGAGDSAKRLSITGMLISTSTLVSPSLQQVHRIAVLDDQNATRTTKASAARPRLPITNSELTSKLGSRTHYFFPAEYLGGGPLARGVRVVTPEVTPAAFASLLEQAWRREQTRHCSVEEVKSRAKLRNRKGQGQGAADRGLECVPRPGKSTTCEECRNAKSKCKRLGAEVTGKKVRQRKQVEEEESLRGKKKRTRTEELSDSEGDLVEARKDVRVWDAKTHSGPRYQRSPKLGRL
ncbi:hypothetical protein OG21DRAFT_1522667 [Imleria badia]|nr:hypothetical protein OG21DRAFT_1522667 [Imleria badia]